MFLASIVNTIIISLCVLLHYEALARLSIMLPNVKVMRRLKVLLGLLGAFAAHVIEIWVFALGYYVLIESNRFGELTGDIDHKLLDYVYYSFVTYTSLGFGDVLPTHHLRFLSGLEALTGLILIAWSASFIYVEMQKYWKH